MIFKAGEASGKSGSFFFFSHDKQFIVKTMTKSDLKTFKKIFRCYFSTICSRPNSLLARIYGIYTIKMENIVPVSLMVMGNSKKANDKLVEHVFDLKGSVIGRFEKGKNLKNTATLKDVNLINLCKEKFVIIHNIILI
jgi:1-phosphatidylinositol-4-phosphate 5-kinase